MLQWYRCVGYGKLGAGTDLDARPERNTFDFSRVLGAGDMNQWLTS